MSVDIDIRCIGGNCPVQAEGTIDGKEFYFRARHMHWSIGIGGEPVCEPEWFWEADYGDLPFDAGWMHEDEARAFIQKAAERYARGEKSKERER